MRIERAAPLVGLLLTGACELREVTVAEPEEVLIAEVILQAGARVQTAYLHTTATGGGSTRVLDAQVTVIDEATGSELRLEAGADSLCIQSSGVEPTPGVGTCYSARVAQDAVRTGARYRLEVQLPDGRRLSGVTTVPQSFEIVRPAEPCALAPNTSIELRWTRSAGAWVYLVEASFFGLIDALRQAGVEVPSREDPLDLLGLSIGAEDTTMVFPAGIGLFSRADQTLHPLLLAMRDGLPAGVRADVAVVAVDRNYVNWIRGGSFNPSGAVRVPSLSGNGTGVFGSLVVRRTGILTTAGGPPPCR
jgi:hypothetical protein